MRENAEALTLIGSLEIPTSLLQFTEHMARQGWRTEGGSLLAHEHMELHLEGEAFVLLHGRLDQLEYLPLLIEMLREAGAQWQIDVFEEDGRLIKRVQG